jgi:acyl carrier protein
MRLIYVSSNATPRTEDLEMPNIDADVRNRIVSLVTAILKQNSIDADVAFDTRLVDIGLTSMDMVNLMLGIEAEFDFMIPQDQITPENFQSVETLERLVAGQLAQAA